MPLPIRSSTSWELCSAGLSIPFEERITEVKKEWAAHICVLLLQRSPWGTGEVEGGGLLRALLSSLSSFAYISFLHLQILLARGGMDCRMANHCDTGCWTILMQLSTCLLTLSYLLIRFSMILNFSIKFKLDFFFANRPQNVYGFFVHQNGIWYVCNKISLCGHNITSNLQNGDNFTGKGVPLIHSRPNAWCYHYIPFTFHLPIFCCFIMPSESLFMLISMTVLK